MRGNRTWHTSLDDYDMTGSVDPDNYQIGSGTRVWPAAHCGSRLPEHELRTLGGGCCWCGEYSNHDWPGRTDGAPHPR